ncbi:MAG: DUF2182 domain-containing protein [Thermoproteota archaeon]|nr:DUF2182 domain-containing protein [Thermoproteota archaeon]
MVSLIATSALAWVASIDQPDMMIAMTSYNLWAIFLFAASWTAGMAAMMFPAITPMVLMYKRLVTNKANNGASQSSVTIQEEEKHKHNAILSFPSSRVILFVGCYLLVWGLTGIVLLLGWSVVMNNTIMTAANTSFIQYLYGALLIMAGAYQFTPLKRICIGYCESPLSFFMRRWSDGTSGALKMGLYHGMYCLGCCWAYFLIMVALGWMNLLWMGLFAGIIFGEKMWSRGIWIARAAGIGLAIVGILVVAGMTPTIISSASSMVEVEDAAEDDDGMAMRVNDTVNNKNNDMNESSPEPSMDMSDESIQSSGATDQSDGMTSYYDNHQRKTMHNDNGTIKAEMTDMK